MHKYKRLTFIDEQILMHLWLHDFIWHITYTSTSAIYKKYSHHSKKKMETRIIKNIFNKNLRRCRDVKTKKACEQGWEANIGPKIKQTISI